MHGTWLYWFCLGMNRPSKNVSPGGSYSPGCIEHCLALLPGFGLLQHPPQDQQVPILQNARTSLHAIRHHILPVTGLKAEHTMARSDSA